MHAQVAGFLRTGRTEREVGADIADAILAAGHERVDFVIVASGPNGASPHHELSDGILQAGDTVVVDIGGTMPDGYCTVTPRACTAWASRRRRSVRSSRPCEAQALAVAAVRPGVSCESIDAVARDHLATAGLAEFFIHRTGHGIGLETHEDPTSSRATVGSSNQAWRSASNRACIAQAPTARGSKTSWCAPKTGS